MKQYGVLTAEELIQKSDKWLDSTIGIHGIEMRHELSGKMVSEVTNTEKTPKSIQNTRAFGIFTTDFNYIKMNLTNTSTHLAENFANMTQSVHKSELC